ncbi:MAG: type IV pilus biogenesis/stability protein PilW [Sedimentisphaerales bacterium]
MRKIIIICICLSLLACASAKEKENTFKKADINLRLGVKYLQQGKLDVALEKMQKSLSYEPNYPEAHSSIALVYDLMGEYEKSIDHYEKAVDLEPSSGVIQNNYAELLCRIGKPSDAEKHFLAAINDRKYKTPEKALENLGVCMTRVPDMDKAEKYLRKALELNPRLPIALLNMALVSINSKNYLSGRAYLERFQEVGVMNPESLWLGIQIEKHLGDEKAVSNYENLLRRKFPDSNETRLLMEQTTGNNAK